VALSAFLEGDCVRSPEIAVDYRAVGTGVGYLLGYGDDVRDILEPQCDSGENS
jgi:hypothetical protein